MVYLCSNPAIMGAAKGLSIDLAWMLPRRDMR
jgi:hypothetical protein